MAYSLIEPPDDRYSDAALEIWENHLLWLQELHLADPDNEGVESSMFEAKHTIAQMRSSHHESATKI